MKPIYNSISLTYDFIRFVHVLREFKVFPYEWDEYPDYETIVDKIQLFAYKKL